MHLEIQTFKEVREANEGLGKSGDWLFINLRPRMAWPIRAQVIEFEEHEIWLLPITRDAKPGLAARNSRLDRDATLAMLYRLTSLISWYKDDGVIVTNHGGGSPMLPAYGKDNDNHIILPDTFDFHRMPPVTDDKGKLAIALMREGRGLTHPAYSFLTFYRVLECAIADGRQRSKWIEDNVKNLTRGRTAEALEQLGLSDPRDIGLHIFNSGRNAVAHARGDPIANPDDPIEYQRLQRERPIIEGLASLAIEKILGIKTSHTIYREHLYELEGWKARFGKDLIEIISNNEKIDPLTTIDLPEINVRLRLSEAFEPLENMSPLGWDVHESQAVVQFQSQDGFVSMTFLLDFRNERLVFPLENGIRFEDDGSAAAAQTAKSIVKFNHDYNANGELQIWDAETDTLMSRLEAFIPVNVIFNPEGAKAQLEQWDREISRRLMAGK